MKSRFPEINTARSNESHVYAMIFHISFQIIHLGG
jgi:hypothetical protein